MAQAPRQESMEPASNRRRQLVADDEAEFGYMSDHRPVSPLAVVGPFGIALIRDDLRRDDVEREG
jgi:hypothetical protein